MPRFHCPKCGVVLNVPASLAGGKAMCPRCRTTFNVVPKSSQVTARPAAPSKSLPVAPVTYVEEAAARPSGSSAPSILGYIGLMGAFVTVAVAFVPCLWMLATPVAVAFAGVSFIGVIVSHRNRASPWICWAGLGLNLVLATSCFVLTQTTMFRLGESLKRLRDTIQSHQR